MLLDELEKGLQELLQACCLRAYPDRWELAEPLAGLLCKVREAQGQGSFLKSF